MRTRRCKPFPPPVVIGVTLPCPALWFSATMARQEAVLGREEMTKRMQMQQVKRAAGVRALFFVVYLLCLIKCVVS